MATIWARRRPIRDGAARSNKPTCRISHLPSAPDTSHGAERKMVLPG
jgi:hypothetical protein